MPTGTLTKKIQRHENDWVSAPPSTRPTAEPPIAIAAQTPSARERSFPSANVVEMIDSAAGEMSAAPSPWSARKPISIPDVEAIPFRNEAAVKMTRPIRKSRFRPRRSPMRPPSRRKPAKTSVYALIDPLQARLAEAERRLDVRQRDVHDRRIENDHELREADDHEYDPGIRGMAAHSAPYVSGLGSPFQASSGRSPYAT